MTEAPLAVAAPVFTLDGEPAAELSRDCIDLEICEGTGGLRRLEARFVAVGAGASSPEQGLLHLDGGRLGLGRTLKVAVGPDQRQRFVFEGAVSAVELILGDGDPPVVVLLAEDPLMRLRMTRRMRTYVDVSDADVASELARLHGLQADVDADADGATYDVLHQLNQSDLAFLRERARLARAELWCTGRTLHFRSRTRRQAPAVTLVRGADLLEVRLVADLADQRSEVAVTGYDAEQREVIDERAGPDVVEAETSGGRTGARLVSSALGESATLRVREAALTAEEARGWARAEMLGRARRFVVARGTTNGTPDLVVGGRLTLAGVGEPFEGDGYVVTDLRHRFDLRRGFRTRFEAERPTVNEVA